MAGLPETPPGADRPGTRERLRRLAVDVTPLRASAAFRRLWIGQSISFVGSEIAAVAAPYQLYRLTHSTLQVGLLGLCELAPLLTLTLAGGTIADAVDRRRLLLRTELGLAAAGAGFAVNAALPHPRIWAIYLLTTVTMAIFSLGVAAMNTVIPSLVPDGQIAAASALDSVYSSLGAVAGPAIGGVLIAAVGLPTVYSINAASFAASLISIRGLPPLLPAPDADRASLRSLLDGFRYLRGERVLLGMFLVDSGAMVFGMPRALFPALALGRFAGGASILGYLYAAPYAGALLASLLSGWVGHVRRQGLVVAIAAALWGVAIALFGLAGPFWLALLLLGVAGAADSISAVVRGTILLTLTPESLRGRISGIEFAQVASTPALGDVEAGVLASLTSLRISIVSGGVACVAAVGLVAVAFPALLRYDSRNRG